MGSKTVVAAMLVLLSAPLARADLVLSVESGGSSSIVVPPGSSFFVDVVLDQTSPGSPIEHNAAIFAINMTQAGLILSSVEWTAPYETGTFTEDSTPLSGDLPIIIDDETWIRPGFPAGVIDISLSNVLFTGTFTTGIIATLEFTIPTDFEPGTVIFTADPDTISSGFETIPTDSGPGLIVTVIPSPAPAAILGGGLACLLGKRRRSTIPPVA